MSKILLLRIFDQPVGLGSQQDHVISLYSDGLSIEQLEQVKNWAERVINDKRACEPKGDSHP
jgi:hypothetical protein